jgi:hypothetical protein
MLTTAENVELSTTAVVAVAGLPRGVTLVERNDLGAEDVVARGNLSIREMSR